jgi:putative transcriptional regulator
VPKHASHLFSRVCFVDCWCDSNIKLVVMRRAGGAGRYDVGDGGSSEAARSRPTEMLLAAYAAGTLSEPFAVLIASHLQMTADSTTPAHERRPSRPIPVIDQLNVFMPLALRSYVGRHLGVPEWRTLVPGLEECRIFRDARAQASFLRCRPGRAIPAHTHGGLEAVLVLQGGFHDQDGHHGVGDIAVADRTIDHRPVADPSVACIIFAVQEAPVRLTGPLGRVVQCLFRR